MSQPLSLYIDIKSPISVYVQIKNQMQFAIASGTIKKGENLPSVRDVAKRLNVNPNTVTKAYRDMELMGLVTTRRGVGVTVIENAVEKSKKSIQLEVGIHLQDAVAECIASGISAKEVHKMVRKTISKRYSPYQRD